MFAVDTNILIYAHFDSYPQHEKARIFVKQHLCGSEDWCLSWQICYEYLRITTHPRVHRRPLSVAEAFQDLEVYLRSDRCHMLSEGPQHRSALLNVFRDAPATSGNLVHDLHYAALLREHGISRIITADADYRRFEFLEVIDPTL